MASQKALPGIQSWWHCSTGKVPLKSRPNRAAKKIKKYEVN